MEYFFEDLIIEVLENDFAEYSFDHIHQIDILNQIFNQNFLEEGFSKNIIVNNVKDYIKKNNVVPLNFK